MQFMSPRGCWWRVILLVKQGDHTHLLDDDVLDFLVALLGNCSMILVLRFVGLVPVPCSTFQLSDIHTIVALRCA